ncbi:DUF6058 family natural product biosynthesis protein [Kitasatospora viridis]|uniref:Uncharacterized protein n=1 Tax=Kitasatospora viridis TaxID=281105 RepID=A0A561T768_9ACTN|nr:DUF6058 family natural product biosynthesis protein [Kitasatospora viridis]TWF82954.1 hypothetical protein FHX73_14437 [Kitasatospora viridis]
MAADLKDELAVRFREVNGEHPMTAADDAYVDAYFVPLERVAAERGEPADAVRKEMLGGRLPLPGYLRSDGTEMVPADLFALADEAGGLAELADWFRAQWSDPALAAEEYESYLSGQYVCLYQVHPRTMQRKDALIAEIRAAIGAVVGAGAPPAAGELAELHRAVDELDALEPPFAAYDRLRFGGPVSRDECITEVRAHHPKP